MTLNCYPEDGMVCFEVRDDAEIPAEYQSQLFVRSFSTKGEGRGLGTYSVKLITEKYLGGCVSFSSSEQTGTVFKVSYPVSLSS